MIEKLLKIIETERLSSISKAAEKLDVSTELVRIMISDLQRMGFIKRVSFGGNCRSCNHCTGASCRKNRGSAGLIVWELATK